VVARAPDLEPERQDRPPARRREADAAALLGPGVLGATEVFALQRAIGNRATTRVIEGASGRLLLRTKKGGRGKGGKGKGGKGGAGPKKAPAPAVENEWLVGLVAPPKPKGPPRKTNKEKAREAAQAKLDEIVDDTTAATEAQRQWIRDYAAGEEIAVTEEEITTAVADLVILAAEIDAAGDRGQRRTVAGRWETAATAARASARGALAPKIVDRDRQNAIRALHDEFVGKRLNAVKAGEVRDAAIGAAAVDAAAAKQRFRAALSAQRTPSRKRWLEHLGLWVGRGGWSLAPAGVYDGKRIHRTYGDDAVRAPGPVNESSADELIDVLFGSVAWHLQNHVSLEVSGTNAHVYWAGNATRGDFVGDWPLAKAALQVAMATWRAELRAAAQAAKDREGDIPVPRDGGA
jgi:hypothetical protein